MKLFFLLIIFALSFTLSEVTHGAPLYSVTPVVIDETAKARDVLERMIRITNLDTTSISVFPIINDISMNEGGVKIPYVSPIESDRTQTLSSWIEIRRRSTTVMPGESVDIPLTIRINPNPLPGTYHATIAFGHGRNRDEAELSAEQSRAPEIVLSVTIDDEKIQFLKLSKFIVDRFVTRVQNQSAVYSFKNPGDEAVTPKGEIIFYDTRGEEVGTTFINTENTVIQPGEEHTFTAPVPAEGKFGKYKAFLSVEYGDTQRGTVQDTSFFYIFPLKTILIILGILFLVIVIGAWYVHKKYFTEEDIDDSDRLMVHVRESQSESKEHDINLKKQ